MGNREKWKIKIKSRIKSKKKGMTIMEIIGAALKLLGEVMGFARERTAAKNTAEMVQAQQRQDAVTERDAAEKAVKKQDAEEVRRRLAE